MQLQDLKTNPIIKAFAYVGFALIIISFVFFYGWNTSSQNQFIQQQAIARVASDDPLSFLPWRKWEPIMPEEVREARSMALSTKLAMLDPVSQMLITQESMRQGINLNQLLVSDEEAILQAIDNRILARKAEELGIVVTREDIIEQIREQPGMNAQLLRQLADRAGLTVDGYIDLLRRQQSIMHVRQFVADEARVSSYDLWREYLISNERVALTLLPFLTSDFAQEAEVGDEELTEYLQAHHEDFRVPAQRRYAYVKADLNEIRRGIQPTDEELQAYLEAHSEEFTTADAAYVEDIYVPVLEDDQPTTEARVLIEDALEEMQANPERPWGEIEDQLSELYPESRIYYRDLGPVDNDQLSRDIHGEEFVQTVFELEAGGVSGIVRHRNGFSIVRRGEAREIQLPPLDEVREDVRTAYIEAESIERLSEAREKLSEVEGYATLAEFAEEQNMTLERTDWVEADRAVIPGVGDLSQHDAYIRNLRPGQVSEAIPTPNVVAALQVIEQRESYLPELSEVRNRVETVVRRRKAIELAEAAAQEAIERALQGADFQTLAEDLGTTLTRTDMFTREEFTGSRGLETVDQPLIGFDRQSLEAPEGTVGFSPLGEDKDSPAGFVLWRVAEIETPSREQFAEDRQTFERRYRRLEQLTLLEEWLADQREEFEYELLNVAGT